MPAPTYTQAPVSDKPDEPLAARLAALRQRIRRAAAAAGRDPGSVRLLAVGKTQPAPVLRACAALGLRDFGENYLQEALAKQAALADLDLTWHFIGRIQRNKTRPLAEAFHWVHSVDRLVVAERLSAQRPAGRPPLDICLQVHIGGETSKGGVAPDELPELARACAALPGLRLRGLMAIPRPSPDPVEQRAQYAELRRLLEALRAGGLELDTLSMGMSADLEAAVREGATWLRIGTALFGPRARRR